MLKMLGLSELLQGNACRVRNAQSSDRDDIAISGPARHSSSNCGTCHMPVKADFLNGYGLALRDAEMKFEEIEALDSDNDGMSNIDEINDESFPGSRATSPEYYIFHVNFSEQDKELGKVHFNHEMHVIKESFLSQGRCKNCHGKNLFPKEFNDDCIHPRTGPPGLLALPRNVG